MAKKIAPKRPPKGPPPPPPPPPAGTPPPPPPRSTPPAKLAALPAPSVWPSEARFAVPQGKPKAKPLPAAGLWPTQEELQAYYGKLGRGSGTSSAGLPLGDYRYDPLAMAIAGPGGAYEQGLVPPSSPGVLTPLGDVGGGGVAGAGGDGGGGGGGGVSAEIPPIHDVQWKPGTFNLTNANAPSWWRPLVPQNSEDAARPDVSFLMTLNTMIPFMSPEDQRRAAATLYSAAADAFSAYKPENITVTAPITETEARLTEKQGLPTINRQYFQSAERARSAIEALSPMREQTVGGNRWKLGPGYTWLQQVLGSAEASGGKGGALPTRTQQLQMLGSLDPLLAQGKSQELGSFGVLGEMLARPFFSAGALTPTTQTQAGRVLFGQYNPLLTT